MMERYAVILVHSTGHALKIEKLLKAAGIPCKLTPPPRHLSSDCGVCVRIAAERTAEAGALVQASQIEIQGIFDI